MNTNSPQNSLADFLRNELFENWKKNREPVKEKWRRNEDAFKGVSRGIWKAEEGKDWRSDTFIMATKIKVLSAYSIVIDIMLQNGVMPFALALSPWDQIVMEDLPENEQEVLQDAIDDMTGLIQQQLVDCKADRELMKCVMAGARYGETYWKSYVHEVTRKGYERISFAPEGMVDLKGQYTRFKYFENKIKAPAFEYVSCWDMFRDMETDDMQKSRGCCQRSYVSPYELRQLIGKPYYFENAIKDVIKSGINDLSGTSNDTESMQPGLRQIKNRYNNIEKLEFWCRAPRRYVEEFEKENGGKGDKATKSDFIENENDGDEVEIGAWLANNEVIRLIRIKPDSRPHGRVVWEINLDDNHGIGVSDNVESVQKVLNGMVRAFEDNKKLSANVIAAIKKSLLVDWSGEFKPGELVEIAEEAKTAAEALQQIIIQDVGATLLDGIGLMERYADEISMLPKILQGAIHEKQKPDTLGEINILQANSGKYLGSVIKNYDEGLIEPVVMRFYEYNMLDPAVKRGKGNYIAQALGFSGFQNKVIRLTKLLHGLQLVLASPLLAQETRLKKLLEEVFKALEIDPQQAFKTKEEKAADAQAMAQAQQQQMDQAGIVLLARFKAETEKAIATIKAEHQAKLEQMEAAHRQKLEQIEAEANNRLIEKVAGGGREEKPKKEKKAA